MRILAGPLARRACLAVAMAAGMAGCGGSDEATPVQFQTIEQAIPAEDAAAVYDKAWSVEKQYLVRNDAEWQAMWSEADPGPWSGTVEISRPSIDFSDKSLVAIQTAVDSCNGRLEIRRAWRTGADLHVEYAAWQDLTPQESFCSAVYSPMRWFGFVSPPVATATFTRVNP